MCGSEEVERGFVDWQISLDCPSLIESVGRRLACCERDARIHLEESISEKLGERIFLLLYEVLHDLPAAEQGESGAGASASPKIAGLFNSALGGSGPLNSIPQLRESKERRFAEGRCPSSDE